jgi:hypothetical protein
MIHTQLAKQRYGIVLSVACGVLLMAWSSAPGAPLGTIRMEGRTLGTTAWQSMLYAVPAGDVIEYRLVADMAPVGTTNGTNTSLARSR